MIEIKRNASSVIAFDESEGRGITFPTNDSVSIEQFIEEVQKISETMKYGLVLVVLLFDPKYKENYRPMSKFLEGKDGPQVLEDDATVRKLYGYYFSHAIPELSPGRVNYIFLG